jgi:AcrR family transcriptional regulator
MDKRLIENTRVKKSIEEALFALLKKKKFSEISISDIIKTSGVARASYYRNYDSKEAIIESYIERQHDEVGNTIRFSENREELFSYENLVASLEYYLKQKYYILQLYDNGFGSLIQDELNRFAEVMLGDMPSRSTERYELYMITGAAFNTIIQWLKNGALESPNEIARVFLDFMSSSKIRNQK